MFLQERGLLVQTLHGHAMCPHWCSAVARTWGQEEHHLPAGGPFLATSLPNLLIKLLKPPPWILRVHAMTREDIEQASNTWTFLQRAGDTPGPEGRLTLCLKVSEQSPHPKPTNRGVISQHTLCPEAQPSAKALPGQCGRWSQG